MNHGLFPCMNMIEEAIDSPMKAKRIKSLPPAPIILPVGPELAYPRA